MSTLVVIGYNDRHQAEEVRLKLLKMQQEYLVDLEDAVVAYRTADGKVKLNQIYNTPAMGAMTGGFWGTLIGCLFFAPIFGMALGAASGAISGALADVGINDDFMKQIAAHLEPGKSALFVLVRSMTPDKVLDQLQGTGGKVLQTSLSKEDEASLQKALDAAKQEAQKVATTV